MNTHSRKSLIGAFALLASLSAPLAFAQSATASAEASPATASATQAKVSTQAADTATTTTAAATVAAPQKKSWTDVDANKDGKLTKAEAGLVPALGQVFDQADGNADGSLTTDEYKAYVAKIQGGASAGNGGSH